jgi:hypothetical protein
MNWYYTGWTEKNKCYKLRQILNLKKKEKKCMVRGTTVIEGWGNKISALNVARVCPLVLLVHVGCREGCDIESCESEEII